MAGVSSRMMQENQQATDQMVQRSRDALRDVGTLNAIFADSGLTGNSQERIAAVTQAQADADLTTIERNRSNKTDQAAAEADAIRAQTVSRINAAPRPSILGTGLQIAGLYYADKNKVK